MHSKANVGETADQKLSLGIEAVEVKHSGNCLLHALYDIVASGRISVKAVLLNEGIRI